MRYLIDIAVLPAVILLAVIYREDKIEKEPPGLIWKLAGFGALTTIGASILEQIGGGILDAVGLTENTLAGSLLVNFLVVALAEEGLKHLALRRTSWHDSAFNYQFDGVVYAVAVSLGFAAAENVLYVMNFGPGVAPIRAVTAIPMHCITGIFMGHYYGMARAHVDQGDVDGMHRYLRLSLLVPIVLHGFYDFAASSSSELMSLIFVGFVVVLDIVAIVSVRRWSREDRPA